MLLQAIDLLEGLIPGKDEHEHVQHLSRVHLSRLFVFALMWSVGALLELDDRSKMEEFLVDQGELDLPEMNKESGETIFEFVVAQDGKRFKLIVVP